MSIETRVFQPQTPKIPYHSKTGAVLPSVTQVLGLRDKSGPLMYWAWDLGKQGKDYRKVKDTAADIGKAAHFMVECYIDGAKPDLSKISDEDRALAEVCFSKFLEFWGSQRLKKLQSEISIVSERHRFGGTLDLVALGPENTLWLIDWKTSKAIYNSYFLQVAAYSKLWEEDQGRPLTDFRIVRMGKEPGSEPTIFDARPGPEDWDVFRAYLNVYYKEQAWPKRLWKDASIKKNGKQPS